MAPFLVSFAFSLAPSLLIFSYCHSRVATRVFFFWYPIFFWFLPSFPFLWHIFFPFPSLLLWRTFSFPFVLPLSLLLSFSPLLFGAPLRPPGVQAHAMHPQDTPLDSLTKILMKCHFKAMYIYYLSSMREGVVTKSTIFMKKNRFWKPYPTLLIIWSFFESCFYGIKMCVSHTWPTWLRKKYPFKPFLFGHIHMYTQISPVKVPLLEKWNILKNYKQFVIHNNKQCEWPNIASTSTSLFNYKLNITMWTIKSAVQ